MAAQQPAVALGVWTYLQCATGTLIAGGGDLSSLAVTLPAHLCFAGVLAVFFEHRVPRRRRVLNCLLAAAALTFCAQYSWSLVVLLALALSTTIALPHLRPGIAERIGLALQRGVLPFLAGYRLLEPRLGTSAMLLALGFFLLLLALGPRATARDPGSSDATPGHWGLLVPAGLAAILAWTWLYGPFPSGAVLASPAGLWLLCLATDHPNRRPRLTTAAQVHLAWTILLASLVLVSAI